jgi:hypothetical protein
LGDGPGSSLLQALRVDRFGQAYRTAERFRQAGLPCHEAEEVLRAIGIVWKEGGDPPGFYPK